MAVIYDGQIYEDGVKPWDLGSFVCVRKEAGKRHYCGLSADTARLPKYADLVTGSTAKCVDTGDFYLYHAPSKEWYLQEDEEGGAIAPGGDAAECLPAGGRQGHMLVKGSDADYDAHWQAIPNQPRFVVHGFPKGTLVDYREKEIRIMLPESTDFTQKIYTGGDADKWYVGFRVYAPGTDVVTAKDAVSETEIPLPIESETIYTLGVDEYTGIDPDGRKYIQWWLSVADLVDGAWTYRGKESTAEKCAGRYFAHEWYDGDGVLAGRDYFRVYYTNEGCHHALKPFYLTEADGVAESGA